MFEFVGASLAAFGIMPDRVLRDATTAEAEMSRLSMMLLLQQSKQVRLGFGLVAVGSLLQCAGSFQAALPFFAG